MELKYQNYIYAVPKSGYYVLEGRNEVDNKVLLNLNDYNQLAYEDFKLCLDESLAGHQDYLFNYYHEQAGLKDLLEALKSRLIADDIYVEFGPDCHNLRKSTGPLYPFTDGFW